MYLINAIFYKGSWTYQFDPTKTADATFTTSTGNTVSCKLMNQENTYAYYATDQVQVIDLPYGDCSFSMTIILPKIGSSIDQYTASLTQQQWNILIGNLDSTRVILSMPKFTMEFDKSLNSELTALGMGIAFSSAANFSNLANGPLFVSEVHHKTYLEVDEEGTTAAAVTSISVGTSVRTETPMMTINHPFILAIREHSSGTILFIGKIVNPNS